MNAKAAEELGDSESREKMIAGLTPEEREVLRQELLRHKSVGDIFLSTN